MSFSGFRPTGSQPGSTLSARQDAAPFQYGSGRALQRDETMDSMTTDPRGRTVYHEGTFDTQASAEDTAGYGSPTSSMSVANSRENSADARARVRVTILGAKSLRGSDWQGKMDPYCVYEVVGRPEQYRTKVVIGSLDPVWNEEKALTAFEPGDKLKFMVVDRTDESVIGHAILDSERFYPTGFVDDLPLATDNSKSKSLASLQVRIMVSGVPLQPPASVEDISMEAQLQRLQPRLEELQRRREVLMQHLGAEKQRSEILQADHAQLSLNSAADPGAKQRREMEAAELRQEREMYYELQDLVMTLQKENALQESRRSQPETADVQQMRANVIDARARAAALRDEVAQLQSQPSVNQGSIATIGLDMNQNGQTDLLVSGVDKNQDGIPDLLQQAVPRSIGTQPGTSELASKLSAVLSRLKDENTLLQQTLREQQRPQAPIASIEADRYVEHPISETLDVEVEEEGKVETIIQQMAEMELACQNRFVEWRAKCKQIEWQPPKVHMKVVEVESGPGCAALLEALQQKEAQIAQVKEELVVAMKASRDPGPREVVTIQRERLLEVPKKTVQEVKVLMFDRQEKLQVQIQQKDLELQTARDELRTLEMRLDEAVRVRRASGVPSNSSTPSLPSGTVNLPGGAIIREPRIIGGGIGGGIGGAPVASPTVGGAYAGSVGVPTMGLGATPVGSSYVYGSAAKEDPSAASTTSVAGASTPGIAGAYAFGGALQVVIVGAQGLPDGWWSTGSSISCEILGKPASRWEADRVGSNLEPSREDPVWREVREMSGFVPGDALRLVARRKGDSGSLGQAILNSGQFYPNGLDATLELSPDSGDTYGSWRGSGNIKLRVWIAPFGSSIPRAPTMIVSSPSPTNTMGQAWSSANGRMGT